MYAAQFAHSYPDRVAITMAASGEQLTYGELECRANRLAHFFRSLGLKRGDHVALVLENQLRYFELMAAAERTGLYYTCVNWRLKPEELAYILEDSTAQVVVSSGALRDIVTSIAGSLSRVRVFLEVRSPTRPPDPIQSYEAVVRSYPSEPIPDEQLGTSMLYSSGTTGRPKGVLRPLPSVHPAVPLPVYTFIRDVLFRMRPGMTYLAPTPLYHSAPQAAISGSIRLGAHAIVMERFDPVDYLALIERHGVTHTQVVPTMLNRLIRLPVEVRDRYDLSSLEVLVHAAAPCPEALKREVIDWLGPIVWEYYGSTEAVGSTVIGPEEWLAHPGSVGKPVLGELEIRDVDGKRCPPGVAGRVWFGGASQFEYFNAPGKTTEAFDGHGTVVGDIGYVDDDGYLYLTDRESFMIISGGVNVYPQETENVLAEHPLVLDVAVFGVPNHDLGEEVRALVVPVEPRAGEELIDELSRFCAERLARIKCPRTIELVDHLPRTDAGKLLKGQLRAQYWDRTR